MNGVAVVIPCFNLGRFLEEAVESVAEQTRPVSEIVVVDDGSVDPLTRRVLDLLRAACRTVRIDHQGVAKTRGVGVALTQAPYVVLLDADDRLDPRFVERLAGRLDEQASLDFVTCGIQAFGEATYQWTPPELRWSAWMARGGPHVSTMFRRRVWQIVGGFDEALEGYEDLDFWLRALEQGYQGERIDEPLLHHRVRAGSRYRQAIVELRYLDTMRRLYDGHRTALQAHWEELALEKVAFLDEQRTYQRSLQVARRRVEGELGDLEKEIAASSNGPAGEARAFLRWGDVRRTAPVSRVWGLDRGQPVDRYYIETFLQSHRADVAGRVLEVKDAGYARWFGAEGLTQVDVVDIDPGNPQATVVADLSSNAPPIASDAYDCCILTQTVHVIFDVRRVIANIYRALRPGGVLLCTVPAVSRVSYEGAGLEGGDFWRFTPAGIRAAVAHVFPAENVDVTAYGNVHVCAAFLIGLSRAEIRPGLLEQEDPAFPLVCCVRAVKPVQDRLRRGLAPAHALGEPGAILLYHRVGAKVPDTHGLSIDIPTFRAHMRYLKSEYRVLALDEFVARQREDTLPDRAVAVTFDDGYLDNVTDALPILEELGLPATFFVNTDRLSEPHETWWDVAERIFSADTLPAKLDLFGDGTWTRRTGTIEDRIRTHREFVELTYPAGVGDRQRALERLGGWWGLSLEPRESHRVLTADEVRDLARRPGCAVGAHTVHHLRLPSHPNACYAEIAESRTELTRVTGRRVASFAYPYGEYDRPTVDAVLAAGFEMATTVDAACVGPAAVPTLLPRLEIERTAGMGFLDRLDAAMAEASRAVQRGQSAIARTEHGPETSLESHDVRNAP